MKDIIQLLLARIGLISGISQALIFNNQLQNPKSEDLIFYPAVFVELMDVQFEPFHGGTERQYGTAEVRFHVVNDNLLQGADLGIYNLKDVVHQYLHRFDGDHFNGLVRTQETLDTDHASLYDYQITYTFRFLEETQPLPSEDTDDFPFDYSLTGTR